MATDVNFGTQQYFGFDPRVIPGCSLWLDGADTRTLTTSGGGNVTQWADKSGAGANMTPVGSQSNATIQTNYQNGLSAVNFAGINVYRTVDGTGVYPSDVYILVALKSLVRMDVIAIGTTTGGGNFNSLTFGEHTALRWHNGSDFFNRTPLMVSPTNETSTSLLLMNWSLANNNFVIRRNGTDLVSTASYTYTLTAPSSIQIGFRHTELTSTTLPLNAFVAEVVTYNRQLRLEERQQVEGYLAWKWGLQANLSTSHPFKGNPPAMRLFEPIDVLNCAVWVDPADRSSILALSGNQPTSIRSKGHQLITLDNAQPVNNAGTGPWIGWPPPGVTNYGTQFMTGTSSNLNTLQFTRTIGGPGGQYGNGYNGSYLRIPAITFTSQQRTMFFVIAAENTGIDDFAHVFGPTVWSGMRQRGYLYYPATAYIMFPLDGSADQVLVTGGVAPYDTVMTQGTPTLFAMRHTTSTTSNYTSINGNSLTPSTNQALTTGYLTGTDEYVIGIYVAYTRQFRMGDFLLYDGAIQTSEIQQIEGYLAWKWGLRASLPTTHPFRNFPPATALFTPAQLSGLVLWMDPIDSTTLTLSGSSVTQWRDKSATGAIFNTVNGNPVYTTSLINGLPGIDLTNATGFISSATQTLTSSLTMAMILVVKSGIGAWGSFFTHGQRDLDFAMERNSISAGTTLQFQTANDNSGANLTFTTDQVSLYLGTMTTGTSRFFERFGGKTTTTTTATNSSTITPGLQTIRIGRSDVGENCNSFIGEIVYYNRVLSTAERQRLEAYLAWKWGLRDSLPSTHPYYKFRP